MRVLIVSGASGGHIFPAISFADSLKAKDSSVEIKFVFPKAAQKNKLVPDTLGVSYISVSQITRKINGKNLQAVCDLFKGTFESAVILLKYHPDIVVGFGSLASVPVVMFAWLFRIKTLIHEQNVLMGKANRFLALFADKIAVSFAETKAYLRNYGNKIIVTGNPLRDSLKKYSKQEAKSFFGLEADKFTVLVMGGSQGAHTINEVFLEAVSSGFLGNNLGIIHLCGRQDFDYLNNKYAALKIKVKLFDFFEKMEYAYSASDLVISRSGAVTITEIMYYGLPCILVPYPFAYQHQIANARVVEQRGGGLIIENDKLNAESLKIVIEDFLSNPQKLDAYRNSYREFSAVSASDTLAEEALRLANV